MSYDKWFERVCHILIIVGVIAFVVILFFLMQADMKKQDELAKLPPPEWKVAPQTYTCTATQSALVEKDTLFCDENTSFLSTYCYGTAIMRNCTKKELAK